MHVILIYLQWIQKCCFTSLALTCRAGGAARADKAFAALEAKYCGKATKRKKASSGAEPSEEEFARIQQQVENRQKKGGSTAGKG